MTSPPGPPLLDYQALDAGIPDLRARFAAATPYPHLVLEDFLQPEWARRAHAAFPGVASGAWIEYRHVNERKVGRNTRETIPADLLRVIDELNGPRFAAWLSACTGIPGLMADPTLEGGGLHQVERGGFLNVHADFTVHVHRRDWARRVNLLVYLNPGWRDEFGGHLELWDRQMRRCVRKILPAFNRCVIFRTDPESFHGHPDPLTCPPEESRKSLALYYYTPATADVRVRSTAYQPRPTDDRIRRALIGADTLALRGYDALKRRLGFGDAALSTVLRWVSRRR
jgi:hypothetical protein